MPKWTNLKHVYDALSIFLIEECNHQLPQFYNAARGRRGSPDLKAIAQHGSLEDIVLLLKLCVVAATSCHDNTRFVQPMQDLPAGVQKVLYETIQEASEGADEGDVDDEGIRSHEEEIDDEPYEEEQEQSVSTELEVADKTVPTGTSALANEERLARVIADHQRTSREKDELQRHMDDLSARHNSLQERYDRSQDDLNEANDRLTAVLSGRAGSAEKSSEAQKEAVIVSLEARVAEYETDIESLRRNNEVLKIKAERVQKLQDDYDEIKIERDSLTRKANAAEKYRQKLEASQDQERENTSLKQKIADLQTQLRQSDTRTASSSDLQREIDEYRRLLPAIEQERHEVNEMKKRLEFDYHLLQARFSESEEQLRRSRQEVEDLQGRLRDYEDGVEPASRNVENESEEIVGRDLESEEADFEAAQNSLNEALMRSEAASAAAADTQPLQTNGGDTKAAASMLGKLDLDENGISEAELRAIMSAMRAQMAAGTSQERESGLKMQKKMVIMLEKARSKNTTLVDHIRKQNDLITELEQLPEKPSEEPQQKPKEEPKTETELEQQLDEQDVLIENLKREIRLISSAWYEQNQRLATLGSGTGSGAVALMRLKGGNGLEEPKSFLGRQRKMLDRAAIGGGVVSGTSRR